MNIDISTLEIYIALILNSLFTGVGVALGTYIANEHLIHKGKKIIKKLFSKNTKD